MSNDLIVPDFAETVRDRVKNAFVDIITDEQWDTIINDEVKAFMAPNHHDNTRASTLQNIVRAQIDKMMKAKIKTLLHSAEYQGVWGKVGEQLPKVIADVLKDNAQEMLVTMITNVAGNVLQNMRNEY